MYINNNTQKQNDSNHSWNMWTKSKLSLTHLFWRGITLASFIVGVMIEKTNLNYWIYWKRFARMMWDDKTIGYVNRTSDRRSSMEKWDSNSFDCLLINWKFIKAEVNTLNVKPSVSGQQLCFFWNTKATNKTSTCIVENVRITRNEEIVCWWESILWEIIQQRKKQSYPSLCLFILDRARNVFWSQRWSAQIGPLVCRLEMAELLHTTWQHQVE